MGCQGYSRCSPGRWKDQELLQLLWWSPRARCKLTSLPLVSPLTSQAADNALGYKFSWSPAGVLMALNNDGKFLKDGKVTEIAGKDLM